MNCASVLLIRGANTFGPYQYPEKVIPLFVTNALENRPLPLYGDGRQVRDWLYVLDHCAAIDLVLRHGRDGEIYNVGGGPGIENRELTRRILRYVRDLGMRTTTYSAHYAGQLAAPAATAV